MRIARYIDAEHELMTGRVDSEGNVFPAIDESDEGLVFADKPGEAEFVLAPLDPTNVFAVGRNYRAHAAETGAQTPERPLVFLKPTSAVIGPSDQIVIPNAAPNEVDFEAELAIIIGAEARDVPEDEALDYVFGYTCANDVTARDCQREDKQWARAKGFDTFCPLGPWIVTRDELDPSDLQIRSILNGDVMQDARTRDMVFSPATIVSYLSHQFTLLPGTVILTGTPEGVGMARKPPVFLKSGDEITIEIEGIGKLTNLIVTEDDMLDFEVEDDDDE